MGIVSEKRALVKVGQRFGKLTVIGRPFNFRPNQGMSRKTHVMCECDCGNVTFASQSMMLRGATKSCGCGRAHKTTHGLTRKNGEVTRLFSCWCAMKQRCYSENHPVYRYYGERGIRICDEWLNSFEAFHDWSMSNGYNYGLTIERNEVNGNYEPGNCSWATRKQQSNNTRQCVVVEAFGERMNLTQWVESGKSVVSRETLGHRIKSGWSPEKALTKPSQVQKRNLKCSETS